MDHDCLGEEVWGYHLLVDCAGCNDNILDAEPLKEFTKDLVDRIDMVAYGEPVLAHFATHDPSKGGYTLTQMISTSLIDGHFVDATKKAFLSVHSCKPFDVEVVKAVVHEHFEPRVVKTHLIERKI